VKRDEALPQKVLPMSASLDLIGVEAAHMFDFSEWNVQDELQPKASAFSDS
jgi:hypothetical protein